MGSYRKRDMDVEREIAKFLDKYLYTIPYLQKRLEQTIPSRN